MLTRKQHDLLTFINSRLSESGISPSFEEMKEALALKSKSGVHRLINALEERAFIRRLPNRARALEVLRMPETTQRTAAAPKGEVVHADFRKRPVPANDVVELALHGRIAAGQPIEAFEDDRMLSVPAALLGPGDIVVALVDGSDATLKILKHAKGMVELEPANAMYSTQRYLPSRVRVQGKLAGLLRRYA
jgi:repressor LexA